MRISDSQRIRVALAVAALRHKPKDVSIAAYVLDLQEKFPLKEKRRNESDSGEPWRDRALKLEEEVKDLKRKYEVDLAELSILRKNVAQESGAKKRKKVQPGREGSGASTASLRSIETALGELNVESSAPELNAPLGLFNSYQRLYNLSTGQTSASNDACQLLTAAGDVLRALSKTLHVILSQERLMLISSAVLNDFSTILCSTLSRAISLLSSSTPSPRRRTQSSTALDQSIDSIFASLTSDIVLPLIKSFARISEAAHLSMLISARQQKAGESSDSVDFKAILEGILLILKGVTLIAGKGSTDYCHRLLEVVKLSAITEIERLWTDSGKDVENSDDPTRVEGTDSPEPSACMQPIQKIQRRERIQRLARGTSLWYLVTVAHDALNSSRSWKSEAPNIPPDIVQEKLDVVLSRLLVRHSDSIVISPALEVRGLTRMTDVEKGLIVSVIENIWLSQY